VTAIHEISGLDNHEIDGHQYCSRSVSCIFILVRGYTRFEGSIFNGSSAVVMFYKKK
jgi:hypothetical protein